MDTSLHRYSGAILLIDFKVINTIVKSIRCLTRSQCRFLKNWGDMIIFTSICYHASCIILDSLKVINVIIRYVLQRELQ